MSGSGCPFVTLRAGHSQHIGNSSKSEDPESRFSGEDVFSDIAAKPVRGQSACKADDIFKTQC